MDGLCDLKEDVSDLRDLQTPYGFLTSQGLHRYINIV